MKYYSEKLNKLYDSEEKLFDDERVYEEQLTEKKQKEELLKSQRKDRANEIIKATEDYNNYVQEAQKKEQELLDKVISLRNDFIKDYGCFNVSYKTTSPIVKAPKSIFDIFYDIFNF